jgi:nucleotide-binding universal stress UspA family protein
VARENRRVRALADAVAERALGEAAATGVNCTIEKPHFVYPDLIASFVAQSRVHDIIVLDAATTDFMPAALFHSGRPVIVVPAGLNDFSCARAIIAWDGSAGAARAVNDARPFLHAVDDVEIVSVQGEKDLSKAVPGAELAPHLARHGVKVTVKDILDRDGDVPRALRDEAALIEADFIVMGAFVHSRVREWILGGVTRSLLKNSPVPLLLSH